MKKIIMLFIALTTMPLAYADKPDKYMVEFDGPEEFACEGFTVNNDAHIIFESKDFFDHDGNYVRTQIITEVSDDFYRSDLPEGTHLLSTGHSNVRIEWNEQGGYTTWTQSGLALNAPVTIPGYGPILKDVGRLVFNLDAGWDITFSAGKRHALNDGTLADALCSYFM